jgi:hypothetical protein
MTMRLLSGYVTLAACGIGSILWGQPGETASAKARLVVKNVVPQIDVVVELQAGGEQAVVPVCGETEYGTPILCILKTRLQVQTRGGWRPVRLRTTYGVLGGSPEGRITGKVVQPMGKGTFVFVFSRRYFDVEVGQRLRILVDAWPDEQSMRSRGTPIQMASTPFECPESGTGH